MARVLTLCPYPLLPLRGGGALRCFHLLRQLARFHEVHAIVFQKEQELRSEIDGYKIPDAVRIYSPVDEPPPPTLFDALPRRVRAGLHYRWLRRSWRGPAESTLLRCHHLLKKVLTSQTIDVVLFEHLSSMMAAPLVQRLSPGSLRILDAHNVDHRLEPRLRALSAQPMTSAALRRGEQAVEWHEQHLSRSVQAVWTCSEDDRRILAACNPLPIAVVPNGVDLAQRPYDPRPDKAATLEILFCGSLAYPPNIDGLLWFASEAWPLIVQRQPRARLTVIGRGGTPERFAALRATPGIDFVGEVADVTPYYARAGVFVCPLREGSGTRLKILEAMALGNPVVSTGIGAEGIQVRHEQDVLLADQPQAFAEQVLRLLQQPALFERLRIQGRALVERHYDWAVIGTQVATVLEQYPRPEPA